MEVDQSARFISPQGAIPERLSEDAKSENRAERIARSAGALLAIHRICPIVLFKSSQQAVRTLA
jgi:hypothetical protein